MIMARLKKIGARPAMNTRSESVTRFDRLGVLVLGRMVFRRWVAQGSDQAVRR